MSANAFATPARVKPLPHNPPIGLGEGCFVVYALLYFAGGLLPLITPDGGLKQSAVADFASSVIQVTIYAGAAPLMLSRRWQMWHALRAYKPTLMLLVMAAVSPLWSSMPGLTARPVALLFIAAAFGTYLGVRFSPSQQLKLICVAVAIAAILSTLVGLAAPWQAVDVKTGSLRGIFPTKNSLGRMMGLGVVGFYLLPVRRGLAFLRGAAIAGCLVLILLADSLTPLAIAIALVLLKRPIISSRDRRNLWKWSIAAVAVVAFGVFIAVENIEAILDMIGRDSLLTGRIPVWIYLVPDIAKRPLLGFGYGVYWNPAAGNADYIASRVGWYPGQSHNGYLQLCLNLGLVGVAIFLVAYATVFKRATAFLRHTSGRDSMWPVAFLLFMLLYNFAESGILEAVDLTTMLFFVISATVFRWSEIPPCGTPGARVRRDPLTKGPSTPVCAPA